MCGITGIYGLSDKKLIKRMTDTLKHRGPDGEGYHIDKNISLGHRRLSIIDLKTGDQPMYNEDKSIVVVYNGEIYNYKELRTRLESGRKHKFHTSSDTEVLLHLYEEHGDNFVGMLNGMFAFALYDSKKKKLLLARDRIGIKPLYYTIVGGLLIFGSEIKSILQYDGINREIDKEGLSSYLTFGSVLGDKTLFKGIKKLEPGYILTYDGNRILTKKYYIMREEILYHNEDIAAKRLRQLLEESVNSQLMSDVPLGAFLSGGIDSSTVVGLMSRIVSRPVKTFTVGFGRSDDELKYAKIASEHFSTDHREIMVCPKDVPPIISKLVWHYDDLIWDAASVPTYFVSEFARKYVKVVLTGEGGDELFAGYNRYKPFSPYMALIPIPLKKYMFDKFVRLFDADDRERIYKFGKSYSENIENNYFKMKPILKGVLMFGRNETLPNQLLTKVDRASMAASLEARVPLLDNRMIDFSDSIPLSMKLKGFLGKYIIRKAVKDLVPTEIIKRKKQGFGASALQWFTNPEVMEFAENVLDRPHILLEGLDYSYVNSLMKLKGIRKGRQAYQLWSLLELEIWYRTFIEGNGSRQVKL